MSLTIAPEPDYLAIKNEAERTALAALAIENSDLKAALAVTTASRDYIRIRALNAEKRVGELEGELITLQSKYDALAETIVVEDHAPESLVVPDGHLIR